MIIGDRYVYLQMQKTASTRIAEILVYLAGGESVGRKHAGMDSKPKDKLVIGSIRNPWAWYVSLWAFGCEGKGGLYGKLRARDYGYYSWFWPVVYSDVNDPRNFRAWLNNVRDWSILNYRNSLMTYRYNLVYQNVVDAWVRVEDMANDLGKALRTAGYTTNLNELKYLCSIESNSSKHRDYRFYYDADTRRLVYDAEQAIIKEFNYTYDG